LYSLSITWRFY